MTPDPALFPDVPEFGRGHWWPWRLTPAAKPRARTAAEADAAAKAVENHAADLTAGVVILARDCEGRPAAVLRADRAFVAGPVLPVEILRRIRERSRGGVDRLAAASNDRL